VKCLGCNDEYNGDNNDSLCRECAQSREDSEVESVMQTFGKETDGDYKELLSFLQEKEDRQNKRDQLKELDDEIDKAAMSLGSCLMSLKSICEGGKLFEHLVEFREQDVEQSRAILIEACAKKYRLLRGE
jgi:hypothetical protein